MNLNLQKMLKPKENAKEVTAEMVEGEEEGMEEMDEEENADESREGSEFDEEDGEQETTDAGNGKFDTKYKAMREFTSAEQYLHSDFYL